MDDDMDELFNKRDVRKRKDKDKKRTHKQTSEKDELAKESFKKMREELDELRKREAHRTRELDELKKKVEDQEKGKNKKDRDVEPEYEFQFNKDEYLNKGFIDSAKWIKDDLSKRVTEKMLESTNKARFEAILLVKRSSSYLGTRTCARFNRGEPCHQGKWHTTHKPEGLWTRHGPLQHQHRDEEVSAEADGRRSEIRLHACTLCFEILGAAYGHSVINCPWILKKNWKV